MWKPQNLANLQKYNVSQVAEVLKVWPFSLGMFILTEEPSLYSTSL